MRQAIKHLRPPTWVSCSTLAAELDISETTVREMVARGTIPKPVRFSDGCVRWPWDDVQMALRGAVSASAGRSDDPYMVGAVHATAAPKS